MERLNRKITMLTRKHDMIARLNIQIRTDGILLSRLLFTKFVEEGVQAEDLPLSLYTDVDKFARRIHRDRSNRLFGDVFLDVKEDNWETINKVLEVSWKAGHKEDYFIPINEFLFNKEEINVVKKETAVSELKLIYAEDGNVQLRTDFSLGNTGYGKSKDYVIQVNKVLEAFSIDERLDIPKRIESNFDKQKTIQNILKAEKEVNKSIKTKEEGYLGNIFLDDIKGNDIQTYLYFIRRTLNQQTATMRVRAKGYFLNIGNIDTEKHSVGLPFDIVYDDYGLSGKVQRGRYQKQGSDGRGYNVLNDISSQQTFSDWEQLYSLYLGEEVYNQLIERDLAIELALGVGKPVKINEYNDRKIVILDGEGRVFMYIHSIKGVAEESKTQLLKGAQNLWKALNNK